MNKECTILIKDEVNCAVLGLSDSHYSALGEKFGIFAPGYFFNPKFKLGSWDGKIRYFGTSGNTYVHLLDDIVPILISLGYKLKLVDNRTANTTELPTIDADYFNDISAEEITLRDYQVDIVNTLIEAGSGVVEAATGAGKTLMCACLSHVIHTSTNHRVIIVVPNQDLITQTKVDFVDWGLDTGEYSGTLKDIDRPFVVSTWQALQHNPTVLRNFGAIIVDECHGLKGNVLQKLLTKNGRQIAYRFGVTGTIPKDETSAMAVRICVGRTLKKITAKQLMDDNWLASLDISVLKLHEDLKSDYDKFMANNPNSTLTYRQFRGQYLPEWSDEVNYLLRNKQRMEWISSYITKLKDKATQRNVFCLVNNIKYGKKLAESIPNAHFVHGKDKKQARQEIYRLFDEHDDVVVIATIHVAGVGLNVKRIFNLVFIDIGKSFIRVIQAIGRGLRKAHDKDSVHVHDICSDLKYGSAHLTARKKFYNEAQYPFTEQKIQYDRELDVI